MITLWKFGDLPRGRKILPPEMVRRSWVEDWRADFRLRWVFPRFRGGPQSGCHLLVSSPRRLERSVRFSRTTLTCLLHAPGYETLAVDDA